LKNLYRVATWTSSICDIEPIEVRKNSIGIYSWMDEEQVRKNIRALEELLDEPPEPELIRVVK
jgi:hypothetical protein